MSKLKKKTIAAISMCAAMALAFSACHITITDGKTTSGPSTEQIDFTSEETTLAENSNDEGPDRENTELVSSSEPIFENEGETDTENVESSSSGFDPVDIPSNFDGSDKEGRELDTFSEELFKGTGYEFKTDKNWKFYAKDKNGVEYMLDRRNPQSDSEKTAFIGINSITYPYSETSSLSEVAAGIVKKYEDRGDTVRPSEKYTIGQHTAYSIVTSETNDYGQTILTNEIYIANDETLTEGETIVIALLTSEESIFTSMNEDFVSVLDSLVINETPVAVVPSENEGTSSISEQLPEINVEITDDWEVFPTEDDATIDSLYSKSSVVDGSANAFFYVQKLTNNAQGYSISEVGEVFISNLDPSYEIVQHGECTVNNIDAYRIILKSDSNGKTLITDEVLVSNEGTVYGLSIFALEDYYETAFEEALPLFNSVTFNAQ